MEPFIREMSALVAIPTPARAFLMTNDAEALAAAWSAGRSEGHISNRLSAWQLPCLFYAGTEDRDFFESARRAASEIPGAVFVALPGQDHFRAAVEVDSVLAHVRSLLESVNPSSLVETTSDPGL